MQHSKEKKKLTRKKTDAWNESEIPAQKKMKNFNWQQQKNGAEVLKKTHDP
jgi:hypothetical protein